MTIGLKLEGALHYADAAAAVAAHASMMEGRADNGILTDGATVDGASIRFAYNDFLPTSVAQDWIDSSDSAVEKATVTALRGAVVQTFEDGYSQTTTALGRAYWYARWDREELGFHEGKVNELLAAHIGALEHKPGKLRVLVPLAGKAEDLRWLAARGHDVVGVEIVIGAIDAFFSQQDLDLWNSRSQLGQYECFVTGGVTMLCQDIFKLKAAELGPFDALYDREALVALEPSSRERYVAACRAFLKEDAKILLVAHPSVDAATVESLYGGAKILGTASDETAYLVC